MPDTDVTLEIELDDGVELSGAVKVSVNVNYTSRNTSEKCTVSTSTSLEVTNDRSLAEEKVRSDVIALSAIRAAAQLAMVGKYRQARVRMLSAQRLLERSMKTSEQQKAYLGFLGQAEMLDGFMRE